LPCSNSTELGLALADGLGAIEFEGEALTAFWPTPLRPTELLEGLAVVFGAGVDDGDAVHQLAERDAAAVVAHLDGAVGELDLDLACRRPS
jgi:hypothetical protein